MCVAFFTLDHPEYALNRDEQLARPTESACFHSFRDGDGDGDGDGKHSNVLSGIDLQAGGTWLGLTRTGKLALLTNITEPYGKYGPSRGVLLTSFLSSPPSRSLEASVRRLVPADARYAGFNLLYLEPANALPPSSTFSFDAVFVTNHGGGGPITYRTLKDAQRHCGALSNGIDGQGADEWPKVQHGVRAFEDLLNDLPPSTPEDQIADRLFDILKWRSSQPPRDRSELKNTILVDPIDIANKPYATRLSTVVLVKRSGDVLFVERDRWQVTKEGRPTLADPSSQRVFRFKLADVSELSNWST